MLKPQYKAALIRAGRVVLYGAIGAAILAVPQLLAEVPAEYQTIGSLVATAIIAGLDKLRRYGQDPGEARA